MNGAKLACRAWLSKGPPPHKNKVMDDLLPPGNTLIQAAINAFRPISNACIENMNWYEPQSSNGSYQVWYGLRNVSLLNQVYSNCIDNSYARQPTPTTLKVSLKPHQAALLQAMIDRETALRNGLEYSPGRKLFSRYAVLGDEVGSGKSLVVLAFIEYMKSQSLPVPAGFHPYSIPYMYSIHTNTPVDSSGASLIIVPHTLFRQWQDYIKTQTSLNVVFCRSRAAIHKDPAAFAQAICSADAVLVSNTLYQDLQIFSEDANIKWRRIFVDEIDTISVPSTRRPLEADMTWFITATWEPILSDQIYLNTRDIDFFLNDGFALNKGIDRDVVALLQKNRISGLYLDDAWTSHRFFKNFITQHPARGLLVVRCRDEFRKESLHLPAVISETVDCEAEWQHRVVASILNPHVQEMLHAGDISGALHSLGVPATTQMSLVDAVTANQAREMQRLQQTLEFKRALEYATPEAKAAALDALEKKITTLQVQIKDLEHRINSTETCPICYEDVRLATYPPCCKQAFCAGCLLTCLTSKPACPLCRTQIQPKELRTIMKTAAGASATTGPDAAAATRRPKKRDALLKVLQDNPTGRFIVFSHYTDTFDTLTQDISGAGISVQTLRGNKDVIHSTLQAFRTGHIRVLLINSQTMSSGLNLEHATHVVLYHKAINYTEETQIIGRAQRLGRSAPLRVVRLLHADER